MHPAVFQYRELFIFVENNSEFNSFLGVAGAMTFTSLMPDLIPLITSIDTEAFILQGCTYPIIDVRSPSEFTQGHIPGALNLPLFDDDERKIVGTLYKQIGRESAILKGLEFAGCKLTHYVNQTGRLAPGKNILLHCWRGGMRSESMAWLLSLAGFNVYLLKGGYKAYRRYISDRWDDEKPVIVLSGKTGSGKTEILRHLQLEGHQVLDLEHIARHKGSAFGAIGELPQPANEQFENDLAKVWLSMDNNRPLWIEDESRSVGSVFLPDKLYRKMQNCPVIVLDMPKSLRVQRLITDYAGFPKDLLVKSTQKISRRLGGQHVKDATEAIENGDFGTAASLILTYYDKSYDYDLEQHHPGNAHFLHTSSPDARENARRVLEFYLTEKLGP